MRFTLMFSIIIFSTVFPFDSWALKDVKLYIPPAVERGHKAVMRCTYNLEGDALYTVKWYKASMEFFRYTPKEIPQMKQFPLPGLRIAEEESNATQLVLSNVQLENSGMYSCEISADQPSFFTEMKTGHLEVVISPREDPKITKIKNKYKLGDTLKGECKSLDSRPPANLTWFVNGRNTKPAHIRHHKPSTYNKTLYTSVSYLQLKVTEELFSGGRLKIRCAANLYNVYHRSFEMSIELDKPKPRYSIIMTTPSTMGFSGSNIHQLDTYPHTTFNQHPPEDTSSISAVKKPLSISVIGIVLLLFLGIR